MRRTAVMLQARILALLEKDYAFAIEAVVCELIAKKTNGYVTPMRFAVVYFYTPISESIPKT